MADTILRILHITHAALDVVVDIVVDHFHEGIGVGADKALELLTGTLAEIKTQKILSLAFLIGQGRLAILDPFIRESDVIGFTSKQYSARHGIAPRYRYISLSGKTESAVATTQKQTATPASDDTGSPWSFSTARR